MTGMIPPFLNNLEFVKLQSNIISSVREGLRDHLIGVKQSKLVMANDI
jgi:asparagine synthetase A